jgi:hypothetical protein
MSRRDPVVRYLRWLDRVLYVLRWPLYRRNACGCEFARFWSEHIVCDEHWPVLKKLAERLFDAVDYSTWDERPKSTPEPEAKP